MMVIHVLGMRRNLYLLIHVMSHHKSLSVRLLVCLSVCLSVFFVSFVLSLCLSHSHYPIVNTIDVRWHLILYMCVPL